MAPTDASAGAQERDATDAPMMMPLESSSGTVVVLESEATGRMLLATEDMFTGALSRFDITARLGRHGNERDYLAHVIQQVREWSPPLRALMRAALAEVNERLRGRRLQLNFPQVLHLIHTTGLDEGGAAYCRGSNVIVFSTNRIEREGLPQLLAHEMFHIFSRTNPEARDKLYEVLSFKRCSTIPVPDELRDLKITNPDAPCSSHTLTMRLGSGRDVRVAPILHSTGEFDITSSKTFFDYLKFRLLVVKEDAMGFVVPSLLEEGGCELLDPKDVDEQYHEAIGRNTKYIIHPQETCADNFAFLVVGVDVPDKSLQTRFLRVLASSSTRPSSKRDDRQPDPPSPPSTLKSAPSFDSFCCTMCGDDGNSQRVVSAIIQRPAGKEILEQGCGCRFYSCQETETKL